MKRIRIIIATLVAYFLCLGGVLPVNAQEPEEEEIEFNVSSKGTYLVSLLHDGKVVSSRQITRK